jgi:hypothetical protein
VIWKREYYCSTYNTDVTLLVGSIDDLNTWLKATYPNADFGDYSGRRSSGKVIEHTGNGFTEFMIWFPSWDRTPGRGQIKTLAHECFHLAAKILRMVGVGLTDESEEAFAYLQSAFILDMWKGLDRYVEGETARRSKERARRAAQRTNKPSRTVRVREVRTQVLARRRSRG